MVCSSYLKTVILQAGKYIQKVTRGLGQFASLRRSPKTISAVRFSSDRIFPSFRKMMVDTGAATNRGMATNNSPEKLDDGGYASGGWKSEDGKLSCGYSSFRGKRASMEDFYDVKTCKINGQTVCLFGIFDGHGGSRAAEYLKENLFKNLMNHPEFLTNTRLAISETYQQTDSDFLESGKDTFRDDGSTASTAVLVGNHLYVANVGDSRTVISKAGKAIPLSEDHKPNRSDERKRIENAGGVVMWAGTWRVGGVLAMSRAFGNRMLKQFVVAEPEIQELELDEEFELLVLASDGLWDVVPNEDAVSLALLEEEPESAARKLTETAFSRGSADNITCIVVRLYHELETKPQPETQTQSDTEMEPQAQIDPKTEPKTETEAETKTEAQTETEPEATSKAQTETEPEARTGPEGQTETVTKSGPTDG
ncbi:putative protein-serine/threonine phosphatase [Helianthus annuus]|uniref:protein-serine/threonine phosphatase n=1 Tax=Helianthus annuus TaxID=4232 RepID=A0A251SQ25_HELAN|nr:probable protein phosphatase 2C 76 isoform X1 [Helianthus annuus]KAF5772259.1 putative protein-serine/threonine phosphatase [Helianthus annuus]KAJ0475892.1 putative protein-serine/threonine phosphatase [Helianthus annuus]KAJ0479919.1 putative protein-serine/threonine phosphatase [Helianthus annuus]KAJ0496689.1 putative protein-serine/threonine phosphatase [Helianthus annuus]KAJ0662739.1 putative protein-serine/threonine phosphatase [Helianthus annuus]